MKSLNNILFPNHVCPWWGIYLLDNPIRRIFHQPEKMLAPYVSDKMTVLDIGCGIGYFSIGLARLVGNKGKVISIDVQKKMLKGVKKRALKAGLEHRIHTHLCDSHRLGIKTVGDFILTFWMVHEVPDIENFMSEVFSLLKVGGKYLLVEPKVHVSKQKFSSISNTAIQTGFKILSHPNIALSRALLFEK
ncbi:MAG TPA: class I SAM-dependent methyltransferase [Phycisphaerae bacterium]|nr:class I SAM-dependent methyltransferase [Phycisphaerae bacterium]